MHGRQTIVSAIKPLSRSFWRVWWVMINIIGLSWILDTPQRGEKNAKERNIKEADG
jgi:hypothetical protein